MNTFICTKQHTKRKKEQHKKTAIYSLADIYIKQVVHQINSWTLLLNTVINILSLLQYCTYFSGYVSQICVHWLDLLMISAPAIDNTMRCDDDDDDDADDDDDDDDDET